MFNLLVEYNATAWETDQLMRMDVSRFKEYSGAEAASVFAGSPRTLKLLEKVPALLMYEGQSDSANVDVVRYGFLRGIALSGNELTFRFAEEGRFPRVVLEEFADRLAIHQWEFNHTHWALKDGGIPSAMLTKLLRSYDVVFSFAGEDRVFVEKVAEFLRGKDVRVFYDRDEEAELWGKDLVEHFDWVYRLSGQYCVLFISKHYVRKMWTRHERRAALARALIEHREYILPARFDDTAVPGLLPTIQHASLSEKSPAEFGELILKKLRRE